jgi:hypothetical protein
MRWLWGVGSGEWGRFQVGMLLDVPDELLISGKENKYI